MIYFTFKPEEYLCGSMNHKNASLRKYIANLILTRSATRGILYYIALSEILSDTVVNVLWFDLLNCVSFKLLIIIKKTKPPILLAR